MFVLAFALELGPGPRRKEVLCFPKMQSSEGTGRTVAMKSTPMQDGRSLVHGRVLCSELNPCGRSLASEGLLGASVELEAADDGE